MTRLRLWLVILPLLAAGTQCAASLLDTFAPRSYESAELFSRSRAARRLYLHPRLHAVAAMILGEPAVAIESIFFEYGSAQALHRDPVFVPTAVAGHLHVVDRRLARRARGV